MIQLSGLLGVLRVSYIEPSVQLSWSIADGPARLLERLFAAFPRDVPDCAFPGDVRVREDQFQSNQSEHWSPTEGTDVDWLRPRAPGIVAR